MEDQFKTVWETELVLLKSGEHVNELNLLPTLGSLQRGEYATIIESEKLKEIFAIPDGVSFQTERPLDFLKNLVNNYLSSHTSAIDQLEVLTIGIACLNAFIQSNWTGPEFKCPSAICNALEQPLAKYFSDENPLHRELKDRIRFALAVDGEEINDTVINAELLVAALSLFSSKLIGLRTPDWWLFRAVYVHQQILEEHSPTLYELLNTLSNRVLKVESFSNDRYLQVLSHLEAARVYLHYGRIELADSEIKKALSLLKMNINLTGALGKRTHYQIKEVAQLMIDVKVDRDPDLDQGHFIVETEFIKDIVLNDEVRLPNIAFSRAQDGSYPELLPLEQAVLLAVFVLKKRGQAKDHLQDEELLPFLHCLLSHPKVWSIHFSALHIRSQMESDHKRTVERALFQVQTLMESSQNKTPIASRLNLFHCSYAPSNFIVSSTCASILISVGSVQSALEIYLQIHMWDEVISCYNYLKLRHKAAEVIREQISKSGETVKLLCSLGDATDDTSCYEKAWELSNHRSAQAQRHWGMYYFERKMYKESIEHFNLSLGINSLQIPLWFRLGYANLMDENWEESAAAYRRYCNLEPGSFEAWNNMAKSYILLGQKQRAFFALQEAIKCNYEVWQVWDNLMAVSTDCGEFEEVIHCYHRILDLKDKHVDEQVLGALVSVIIKDMKDARGVPASTHRKKALELFGRITSKVMGNARIWELYAELSSSIEDHTPINQSKVIQYYKKAYTAATQDNKWYKDFESMARVIKMCEKLADSHLVYAKNVSSNEASQSLTSAKFSLVNVLTKVNEQLQNMHASYIKDSFTLEVKSLQRTLEKVQTELASVKGS